MSRVDLNVPYEQKDEARNLGARWDSSRKVWYVPDGVAPEPFSRWLPKAAVESVNLRAARYYIARSETECWKCNKTTIVWGIALPSKHDELEDDGSWWTSDIPGMTLSISYFAPSVVARIKSFIQEQAGSAKIADLFRIDYSKTAESSYWMNHCSECGTKIGDWGLYSEPGGAFFPIDETAAQAISLWPIAEEFACSGSFGYGGFVTDRIVSMEAE